ncbi:angiopoietin-4-like [Xenentodon cancila]
MRSDGGWTVFQRRTGEPLSFNRKWQAYKEGFGRLTNDHWLGLQKVFLLTKNKSSTLRVDLWDYEGGSAFAEYNNFRLGNEQTAYKLHVEEFNGTAGDAIRGAYPGLDQNGYGFSTIDRDNDGCRPCIFGDIARTRCTDITASGWWFSKCGSADLNGDWHPSGDHIGWASGLHWQTWKSVPYSAKASRMMIKSEL